VGQASAPAMICEKCGMEYCFLHSNAHVGKSCQAYERDNLQENKLNEAEISKDSKRCPKCGIAIQKASGCNHMKVPAVSKMTAVPPCSNHVRYTVSNAVWKVRSKLLLACKSHSRFNICVLWVLSTLVTIAVRPWDWYVLL
jgi:hypothetical protein